MKDPRTKRHWHKRPEKEWCRLVRQCGKDGLAVTAAAKRLGINVSTFIRWEAIYPKFRRAAEGVRRNAAAWALSRTQRLMEKSEESLLRALAHVRAEKEAEAARIQKAMAEGRFWTPEQLAAKVQNLKELRREARSEARRNQRQANRWAPGVRRHEAHARAGELTVQTVSYASSAREQ